MDQTVVVDNPDNAGGWTTAVTTVGCLIAIGLGNTRSQGSGSASVVSEGAYLVTLPYEAAVLAAVSVSSRLTLGTRVLYVQRVIRQSEATEIIAECVELARVREPAWRRPV